MGGREFFSGRMWLASLLCMGMLTASDGHLSAQSTPVGLPGGGLRQAFERALYALEASGHGTWNGVNRAQRLMLEFDEREVRLSHPDGSVTFQLTGYGYGGELREPALARLAGTGNRVEYRRGDLTEWYVNGPQGLEQGFTLTQRPGTDRENQSLVIALGVAGLIPILQSGSLLFESSKGVVLRYAGLTALDARGHTLPSRLEIRGREIRLAVDDHDAQYPLTVDPTWTQQQELTASDGVAGDEFGGSVSVSGDTALIGAPGKNQLGAAYVFVRNAGVWTLQQELTSSDGGAIGSSVSVSGDTAVIGGFGDPITNQGGAYVFVRSGGVWAQQQRLTPSDGAPGDYFGSFVSVSGDTALIGANGKNNEQGVAYVFVRSGGVWNQQQELTAFDGAAGDFFGFSVSVSGDAALIGAPNHNAQGAAYMFLGSNGVWTQQQELTASGGAENDAFGTSVYVSGETAVIGAPNGRINFQIQGAAYVFLGSNGVWTQQQELAASDGKEFDGFGTSVSVSEGRVVIGTGNSNSTYVFAGSGGALTQQQELTASDGAPGDFFGNSVSVSGNTAIIGAAEHNNVQGAAYVFVAPALGTNAILVGSAAGISSVVLSCSSAWTATANDSFLHISAGSATGTGNAVVVFTYDAFTGTGTRTGTLTIAGLIVTVTQAGTNYIGPGPVITLVSSGLNVPFRAAVDSLGNLYIADAGNNAIREWSASTQQVSTLVSSSLSHPEGVAVDGSGNVYIADTINNALKEWNATTQLVTTLVSLGLASPTGIAADGFGDVYLADSGNNAIKEWNA